MDEQETNQSREELVEPRFRYKRILSDLIKLMEIDAASCFAINEKILVVGFQSGRVCIFDHIGNVNINSCSRHHKCAVTCVTVDDSANYIASCANDFTVIIFGIGDADYNQRLILKSSPKVISISPDFLRQGSGQSILVGTQDLTLYQRGIRAEFLSGKLRETILYKGTEKDGLIWCISWKNTLIGFTNETGTRIYDLKLSRCITLVQPLHKIENFSISKFPPRHLWLDPSTFAVGWANTLCICGIFSNNKRSSATTEIFDSPKKYGQILHRFIFPGFFLAGLSFTTHSSYGIDTMENNFSSTPIHLSSSTAQINYSLEQQRLFSSPNLLTNDSPTMFTNNSNANKSSWRELVLFGIRKNDIESDLNLTNKSSTTNEKQGIYLVDETSYSTQLLLVRPVALEQYILEAEDTIEMRNVTANFLHRFILCSLPLDNIYYIFTPREAIEALPCSIDYRINWMLKNGLYEEALESATRNSEFLREHTVVDVGKKLINHLIKQHDYEAAVTYMPEVCSTNRVEWEFYVNEFDQHHQVLKILPVLPTENPRLEPEIYETFLIAALYTRPKLFYTLVTHWDPNIYRSASVYKEVCKLVVKHLPIKAKMKLHDDSTLQLYDGNDRTYLIRALAKLSLHCRKYNDAIKAYLILRDPVLFGVIDRYKLFSYVKHNDKIMHLMEINQDLTIRMLIENEDLISADTIVDLLTKHPKIQLAYLHHLHARGKGNMHSDKLVKLYAEHDRVSLLPFLRKNEYYRLDEALNLCKAKNYIEEVVYLLGRSGNRLEALDLMVNKLLKIDMAIDFCMENDDPELWERLIKSAIVRPEQIICLLKRMASIKIDSLDVIEKIPQNMEILDLRQCLLQVLKDHEQQSNLLKHSRNIATSDVLELLKAQLKLTAISSATEFKFDTQELKCIKCHLGFTTTAVAKNEIFLLANGYFMHESCAGRNEKTTTSS